ncbi:MAG: Hsp20/alpha crystallin family protein [Pyrinomonadaceae bacterium]|nr:Hsp20/alpha crystallin family protein [Pyrinomonadaceae bacterium]
MNQLFKAPFSFDNGLSNTVNGPAVTVYETKDEYVFEAELPGWTRDQVSINFENQTLTLSGQRDLMAEDGRQYHRVEGFYGQFTRSFTVPGHVDAGRVEAELKDGVLTVHLPKREEAKPRTIEVKTVQ